MKQGNFYIVLGIIASIILIAVGEEASVAAAVTILLALFAL